MELKRFDALPVDESFFDTAPFIMRETFKANKSAAEVWAELTADDALSWCSLLRDVNWTSPRPFGVGTTRRVKTIANISDLNEYFFRWDEGRRKSFYVVDANAPLFKRFAEDYLLEPTSDSTCDFTWTIAAQPHQVAKLGNPVNRLLMSTLFRDTRKHYAS